MALASGHEHAHSWRPKTLHDTEVRNIGMSLLLGNRGRIENGPDWCSNTNTSGPDHAPQGSTDSEASSMVPNSDLMTDMERRDYVVALLDEVRRQYESTRLNRLRYMRLAREHGLSCHDIGVVLGITENGVRAAIKRANGDV